MHKYWRLYCTGARKSSMKNGAVNNDQDIVQHILYFTSAERMWLHRFPKIHMLLDACAHLTLARFALATGC